MRNRAVSKWALNGFHIQTHVCVCVCESGLHIMIADNFLNKLFLKQKHKNVKKIFIHSSKHNMGIAESVNCSSIWRKFTIVCVCVCVWSGRTNNSFFLSFFLLFYFLFFPSLSFCSGKAKKNRKKNPQIRFHITHSTATQHTALRTHTHCSSENFFFPFLSFLPFLR